MPRQLLILLAACLVGAPLGRASAGANAASATTKAPLRFDEPCEGVVVVADEAPVKLANTVVATVTKGQRFGVRKAKDGLVEIQVFTGKNIRFGWIEGRHVKVLSRQDIDLATEALRIAKELDPAVDVAAHKARMDAITEKVTAAAAGDKPLLAKLQAVSLVLFRDEGFRFERTPRTLNAVLNGKRGNCLGLATLYLCAARELDLPLYMVSVPRHVFVRVDDGKQHLNIEVTMGGILMQDAYVVARRVKPGGPQPKMLSSLEVVGVMQGEAGVMLAEKGDHAKACDRYAQAAQLAPFHAENYHNWGTSLLRLKRQAEACDKLSRAVELNPWNAPAIYTWAVALSNLGEHHWACEKFARATQVDPACARAYYNWGLTLLEMGRRGEGFAKLDKAAELLPALGPQVEQLRQALQQGAFDARTWPPSMDEP